MNIVQSLKCWRYWLYRSYVTNSLRYKGSKLGMFWPILTLLIVTGVLGVVWGVLLEKENQLEYFLYLLCGYPVWTIISGAVEQGCRDVYVKGFGGMPFFTLVLERAAMVFIPFFYMLPVIFLSVFYVKIPDMADVAICITVFVCMLVWVVGMISFLISFISLLPDAKHFIKAMMRLAFLATPIIWETQRLGAYEAYIWINPFYVPLEAFRSSLLMMSKDFHMLMMYFACYSIAVLISGISLLKLRIKFLAN